MDARFYQSEDVDIERLTNDLENVYRAQGYQVQSIGNKDQMMVQLKKGGDFEALIGLQAALSVIIQRSAGGTVAMIGHQKWIDKAAVGAVGLVAAPVLWPLMLTAGAGAIRQASLSNQVLNVVDGLVRQQRPSIQIGPIPIQIMPQLQQQWAPPPTYSPPSSGYIPAPQSVVVSALPAPAPAATQLRCPNCNTPYEPGDTFCSNCGTSLTAPKTLCSNCGSEIKPGAAFCPKCGASTSVPPTQVTMPQTPRPAPKPQPAAPTYQPTAPSYTPPAPKQPEPQPYVPPVPQGQEPPVMPQPSVTLFPGAPKQETPPTPKQPPRRQEPTYKPPVQPLPTQPAASSSQKPPAQPLVARPSNQPVYNPTAIWGSLTFSNGKQINLSGERTVVGRYDHDVGDIKPEVDLSDMQGADTVSRIHATLEHIGSTYTVMDLNSTNATRLNGKRLEPDKATTLNDGDSLQFGKVTCTFKKV